MRRKNKVFGFVSSDLRLVPIVTIPLMSIFILCGEFIRSHGFDHMYVLYSLYYSHACSSLYEHSCWSKEKGKFIFMVVQIPISTLSCKSTIEIPQPCPIFISL